VANVYYDEMGKALVVVEHRFGLDTLKEWAREGIGPQGIIQRICEGRYNPSEETLAEIYAALAHAASVESVPMFVQDRFGERW
jgi:hypothetical protein